MRIKLILLALLLITGVVLGTFYYKNNSASSNDEYMRSLALINQLKQTNAALNVLLLSSRYGLQADYDELAKKNVFLADSVAVLKNSNIAGYIDSNVELSDSIRELEEKIILKVDIVENFKAHNAVLRNSIKYAPPLGDQLVEQIKNDKQKQRNFLESVNQALYRWALYGDKSQADIIQSGARKILDLLPLFENEVPLIEYSSHVIAVVEEQEQTQRYLENALSIDLEPTLGKMESLYTASYLAHSAEKERLSNYAIIGYGLLTLLVAAYFALMLRKSYAELEGKVEDRTAKINSAYKELKESQDQLIQSEKMASLGQMVAGIAHEINTPLGYVNNNVSIVNNLFLSMNTLTKGLGNVYQEAIKIPHDKKILSSHLVQVLRQYRRMQQDGIVEEAKELLEDSSHGLNDIAELVKNLKSFSRLDMRAIERFNVCDGLDSTLKIANSILRKSNVDVIKNYIPDALIDCNPSKINQVFLNIITNAAQAIPESGGQLTINVEKIGNNVRVGFVDTGEGMDEETQSKIFDPFFTTKPVGEGTGLGMSISYKIVKEHKGRIEVESEKGRGAVITVEFPCHDSGL